MPRHHLVPRFYLRRFADDRQNLVVIDRHPPHRSRMRPVKLMCAEEGYYAMPTETIAESHRDGHDPEIVEGLLSRIEHETARALPRLLDGQFPPTSEDRYAITQFIAVQMTRTQRFREDTEALMTLAAQQHIEMELTNNPEQIPRWLKSRGEAHDDAAVRAFRDRLEGEGFPKVKPSQPFAVQESLRMAMIDFHPRLFLRPWRMFHFDADCLVTSDNPVGTWSPQLPEEQPIVDGLNATMIVMPLNRRTALALMKNGADQAAMLPATSTRAKQINLAVMSEASKWIFHHPGDRPLDSVDIPPRTAFVDEVVGVRAPGDGTVRELHRIVKRPVL
ncbi:DUF4238 domain-containing protein [Amycolatopsis sp. NPDC052450]|uniref:DUF4238 domain-containing protein n=1 Tax=Amycolatopsis sp. NPDC052450 TaxID=3363937 RepID=UPI0037CB9ED2